MKSLRNLVVFLALLALVGGALFFYPKSPLYYKQTVSQAEVTDMDAQADTQNDGAGETNGSIDEAETDETDTSQNTPGEANTEVELTEKSIGEADAPITIIEFSSLSCGHCGTFHTEAYPELKQNYIETGKARLVMVDFPLNLPALQGAMLAHCMPEQQYFSFLQLLFTTQSTWLQGDYLAKLKQNAQLAGLSAEEIESCLNNKALEEAILSRMEAAQAQWDVSSTPSFVINDGAEKIIGNKPYADFAATLETLLIEEDGAETEVDSEPASSDESNDSPDIEE